MDKPIDITNYVKTFDLLAKGGFVPKTEPDGGYFLAYEASPLQVEINGTIEAPDELLGKLKDSNSVVKMTTKGRFWFDIAHEADVIMTDMKIGKDNHIEATYKSMVITDLTDYGFAARCLRWLLRR